MRISSDMMPDGQSSLLQLSVAMNGGGVSMYEGPSRSYYHSCMIYGLMEHMEYDRIALSLSTAEFPCQKNGLGSIPN